MDNMKYIGMDVHKEAIFIAVLNSSGKLMIVCVIETKAISILQFFQGLRGSLRVGYSPNLKSPTGLTSVRSEEHESDVESDRHGDQLITKKEVLELILHNVSWPFIA